MMSGMDIIYSISGVWVAGFFLRVMALTVLLSRAASTSRGRMLNLEAALTFFNNAWRWRWRQATVAQVPAASPSFFSPSESVC